MTVTAVMLSYIAARTKQHRLCKVPICEKAAAACRRREARRDICEAI